MKKLIVVLFMLFSFSSFGQSYLMPNMGYGDKLGKTYGVEVGAGLVGPVYLVTHADVWNLEASNLEDAKYEYYAGTGLGVILPVGKRWSVGGMGSYGYASDGNFTYHLESRLYRKFFMFDLFVGYHEFRNNWAVKGGLKINLKRNKKENGD